MPPAYLYPGQGSQSVGMGRQLANASPLAAAVWEQADRAFDAPISRLAWEGPAEELDLTVNAQPALLAASVAAQQALDEAVGAQTSAGSEGAAGAPSAAFLAGHSMGQYSAMVVAGVIDLETGLRLVRERGRLMQAASANGAMAAIIGLDEDHLPDLLAAGSDQGIVTLANRNSPGQVVISGERSAVEAAAGAAKELGARRGIVLPVSVAAHSPLMATAAEGLAAVLADVPFEDPLTALLSNADASRLETGVDCRAELIDHLTRGVDWIRAVEVMADAGVRTFVEVGPGKVLAGLVRRIRPDVTTISIDDMTTETGLEVPDSLFSQE